MDNAKFRIALTTLGLTSSDVAEDLAKDRRTVERWKRTHPVPDYAESYIRGLISRYGQRVADVLETAYDLDSLDEPVTLIAYSNEETTRDRLGMRLSQHEALLGHCIIALEAAEYPWRIIPGEPP